MKRQFDFRSLAYLDFEFAQDERLNPVPRCCAVVSHDGSAREVIWLLNDDMCSYRLDRIERLRELLDGKILVSYLLTAEIKCLKVLGIEALNGIDLYAEFLMLGNSSFEVETRERNLLAALKEFGLTYDTGSIESEIYKQRMRYLALRSDKPYSDEEKHELMEYCLKDTIQLPSLLTVIFNEFEKKDCGITFSQMMGRGEYSKVLGDVELEGLPINKDRLNLIYDNRDIIRAALIDSVSGYGCFVDGRFNKDGFERYIQAVGLEEEWPRTDNDRCKTDRQTLDKMSDIYEQMKPLKNVLASLSQLKGNGSGKDLRDFVSADGFNKTMLSPFGTKTGRNTPSSTGFVLLGPSWMRCVVEPKPGECLIHLDYSQQEFAIAAALSDDANMIAAYNSGDCYLAFAKLSNQIPPDGTKKTHPDIREKFKSCVLGVQYNMGIPSLAKRMKISLDEAERFVEEFHKGVFSRYWEWSDEILEDYKLNEFIQCADGWTQFGDNRKWRSIANFPMQATGAAMLRQAVLLCRSQLNVRVAATLHDAIYVSCKEQEAEETADRVKACMEMVSARLIGEKIRMRVDSKIYRHGEPYYDEKGQQMLRLVKETLAAKKILWV